MSLESDFALRFVSDSCVLLELRPTSIALENSQKIWNCFHHFLTHQDELGINNLSPAYASLLIDLKLKETMNATLELLRHQLALVKAPNESERRLIEIPVQYGGDRGPDLSETAQKLHLSEREIIETHSQTEYAVAFLGFSPGFPYLMGLADSLKTFRKKTPRLRVPEGSVALAGLQTGIYPQETSGGWNLIGQTNLKLFDPFQNPPTLLQPSDRVRFVPVSKLESSGSKSSPAAVPSNSATLFEILEPGAFTTVQDLGRTSCSHWGVPRAGAADSLALRMGNLLVGNQEGASALEMTIQGGRFKFCKDTWISLTGARAQAFLDGNSLRFDVSIPVSQGQHLEIQDIHSQFRTYLCVHGGIDVPPVLGSLSTFVSAQWGGLRGRTLRSGDRLLQGKQNQIAPTFRKLSENFARRLHSTKNRLRVTLAAQSEWFAPETHHDFFSNSFEVSEEINRAGLRLLGPQLKLKDSFKNFEMISEGLPEGSIQVAGNEQAMILFCESGTTGGYPKIASVIRADLWKLGQLKPKDRIQFELVDEPTAWKIQAEQEAFIEECVEEF